MSKEFHSFHLLPPLFMLLPSPFLASGALDLPILSWTIEGSFSVLVNMSINMHVVMIDYVPLFGLPCASI